MDLTARRRPLVTDGASGIDQLRGKINPPNNRNSGGLQVAALRAEITSSTTASAAGVTACGSAPVLALCRELIEAGFDPSRALQAYRGEMLCIIVRTIGEAAALTVDEHNGTGFAKWKAFPRSAVSPQIARRRQAATSLAERAP